MPQNLFWNLLSKKLSGEASPDDIRDLELLVKEYPEFAYQAEQVEMLWKLEMPCSKSYDAELAFQQHLNSLNKNGIYLGNIESPASMYEMERHHSKKKLYLALFLVLTMASIGWFIWKNRQPVMQDEVVYHKTFTGEVSTGMGDRIRMVLPDSTVVWLNAGSKLNYNEKFGITNRNTTLSGEAYFDVRKNSIPFIIQANGVQIKVLGTAFNVKSYPNEKTTETSLLRGKVEITINKRPGEIFLLKPNEKLTVANDLEPKEALPQSKTEPMVVLSGLTHANDNSILETSWKDNKLIFQDESFAELAVKMERWYGVKIVFTSEKIAKERLSGTFTRESVTEALEILQMTTGFRFTHKFDAIIISE